MCHPGITRIIAFICSQNLPCSVDDTHKWSSHVKFAMNVNLVSTALKLIKATQPMQQLNLDFKGPLSSNSTTILLPFKLLWSSTPIFYLQSHVKMSKLFSFTKYYVHFWRNCVYSFRLGCCERSEKGKRSGYKSYHLI